MRGPSEGLHRGPALGRGGRGKGATPQPMAGPRGRDRHAAPPPGRQEAAPGDQRAPPTPPPPPTQAQERTEADRRNGGPAPPPKRLLHPGCGGTTAEAGARTPCLLPADGGPAAPRTAQTERPYQRPDQGRRGREPGRGGSPPLPPPTPPPRRTGPSAADRTAPDARGRPATLTARVYFGGARRRQRMAGRRPTGRGGGGAAPPTPPPPPLPPPSLRATGAALRPPGAEGTPPPPRRDPRRGGGGCGWTCTLRALAPPAACSRGGRGRRASSHQRARATRAPSLGAAHGGAPEQYGGRALHDPPVTTAHSGRAEGGFRSAGAPGGAVHGLPLTHPHLGAAPRPRPHAHAGGECADDTRGARIQYRRPPPRRGAGRPRRDPPPHPPHRPASRGGPGRHPPRQGGWSPPPPERGARARPAPLPQLPAHTGAAENKRACANAPGCRTNRAQRRRASTNRSGMGGHAPHGQHNASDTRFVACPGKAEGRNEAERPPALQASPGRTNGGYGARPPPPARPPAHERHGPTPRHEAPTGRAGRGDREGHPHPHARGQNTWIADPNSPPSGRAVGGGGAPDPRRPSQQ